MIELIRERLNVVAPQAAAEFNILFDFDNAKTADEKLELLVKHMASTRHNLDRLNREVDRLNREVIRLERDKAYSNKYLQEERNRELISRGFRW